MSIALEDIRSKNPENAVATWALNELTPGTGGLNVLQWNKADPYERTAFGTHSRVQDFYTASPSNSSYLTVEGETAIRGTSHDVAEMVEGGKLEPFDIEYAKEVGYDAIHEVEETDRIGKQMFNTRKNLETSGKLLKDEGVAIYNLQDFYHADFNPDKEIGEERERLKSFYSKLVKQEAEKYFEEAWIETDLNDNLEREDAYVIARSPK